MIALLVLDIRRRVAHFVERASAIVAATGKTPIAWHEAGVAGARLASGTIGQYWGLRTPTDGMDEKTRGFVAAGGSVILSPADAIYLDMKFDADAPLGLVWAGVVSARQSYEWDPATVIDGIGDDDIRETIEQNQLRLMNDRGSDVTVFSPRASFMAHHIGDLAVSETWARICNDLCARVAELFPDRFLPGAMLPQSPGVDPSTTIPELTRAVEELGVVTVNLNPDPSGGLWTAPPLTDRSWYPVYEKLVEYELPAMIHVSTSCKPQFHTTGDHYLGADTTAFMHQGLIWESGPSKELFANPQTPELANFVKAGAH